MLAILGEQTRLIVLIDEIIEIVIRLKDYTAAQTAVATVRSAFGTELLSTKSHAALSAVPGTSEHFDFVNEHESV
jgi:hypothetical protein